MRFPKSIGALALGTLLQGPVPAESAEASQVACRMPIADALLFDAKESGVGVVHDLDYGSFRWLVLERSELDRLAASGVECELEPSAAEIRIAGQGYDPLLRTAESAESMTLKTASASGWWIVQFVGPVTDDWLWWLRRSGMDPVQYLPVNATSSGWTDQRNRTGAAPPPHRLSAGRGR